MKTKQNAADKYKVFLSPCNQINFFLTRSMKKRVTFQFLIIRIDSISMRPIDSVFQVANKHFIKLLLLIWVRLLPKFTRSNRFRSWNPKKFLMPFTHTFVSKDRIYQIIYFILCHKRFVSLFHFQFCRCLFFLFIRICKNNFFSAVTVCAS